MMHRCAHESLIYCALLLCCCFSQLFPGPHLYAGGAIVVGWAIAASLVQQMQKGSDAARYGHIGINLAILGLFGWQVNTGLGIVEKVLQFTKFP